jgi:hypothetical protein
VAVLVGVGAPTFKHPHEGVVTYDPGALQGPQVSLIGSPIGRTLAESTLIKIDHHEVVGLDYIFHERQGPDPTRDRVLKGNEHTVHETSPKKPKGHGHRGIPFGLVLETSVALGHLKTTSSLI